MSRTAIMIIAGVVAVLWLAMAATTLVSAWQGAQNGRYDWMLAWGLVGLLLAAAGIAAVVGAWNHQYRVRPR